MVAAQAQVADLAEDGLFKDAYTLGEKIGEGGYSQVFRGRHVESGREVAVKVIAKASMSEGDLQRLLEEVGIMARMAHPHILALHAFYSEPSAFFIVMELCQGGELFDRIVERKSYNEGQARDTLRTLVSAVAFLHAKGIAHRDIKPENILLVSPEAATADIKLGDLGFAKPVPPTGLTTSCGTPSYVAPEIIKGLAYGTPCDMWSLGVILYILLCGYPPFAEANQPDLFKAIMKGRFAFDAEGGWASISPEAKDLVRRLLTVDPAKRAKASDVLAHPWLQGAANSTDLSVARLRMGVFNNARRRIVKMGPLIKQGGFVRSLQRRVFVLSPESLSYYEPREWESKGGGASSTANSRGDYASASGSASGGGGAPYLSLPPLSGGGGKEGEGGGGSSSSGGNDTTTTTPITPPTPTMSAGSAFLAALGLGGGGTTTNTTSTTSSATTTTTSTTTTATSTPPPPHQQGPSFSSQPKPKGVIPLESILSVVGLSLEETKAMGWSESSVAAAASGGGGGVGGGGGLVLLLQPTPLHPTPALPPLFSHGGEQLLWV